MGVGAPGTVPPKWAAFLTQKSAQIFHIVDAPLAPAGICLLLAVGIMLLWIVNCTRNKLNGNSEKKNGTRG